MPELVLIGDSVIDNGAYVADGEPDVAAQLRERLADWTITKRAVDGFVTRDVLEDLLSTPLPDDASVFVSSGGNDALAEMGRLTDPTPMTMAAALAALRDVREAFHAHYDRLLSLLSAHRTLVATIYRPHFTGDQAALQYPGEGGLSAFNDVIQAEAIARGMAVLDLRRVFTDPADYANPIEPSAAGGAKLADAVAAWCEGA